jgi:hypothetical protein
MEIESVGVPAIEQPYYTIVRPVDDLWLWWILAGVVSYVIYKILPTELLGTSALVTLIESPIALAITLIPIIWVLRRYLLNFNWKQWAVVNIVGLLIAIAGLIIALVVEFTFLGLAGGVIRVAMHQPIPKGSFINPITSLWIFSAVILVFATAFSVAQWRVLRQYTREHGLGLWVSANIVSYLIAVSLSMLVKNTFSNAYIIGTFGTIITALTDLIVGYALMQILRPYAPAPHPGTAGV